MNNIVLHFVNNIATNLVLYVPCKQCFDVRHTLQTIFCCTSYLANNVLLYVIPCKQCFAVRHTFQTMFCCTSYLANNVLLYIIPCNVLLYVIPCKQYCAVRHTLQTIIASSNNVIFTSVSCRENQLGRN